MVDEEFAFDEDEELSLLETLDHVLDHGLVIAGEVTIAVADVDLIYLGLNLLLGSVETVNRVLGERELRAELLRVRSHELVTGTSAASLGIVHHDGDPVFGEVLPARE